MIFIYKLQASRLIRHSSLSYQESIDRPSEMKWINEINIMCGGTKQKTVPTAVRPGAWRCGTCWLHRETDDRHILDTNRVLLKLLHTGRRRMETIATKLNNIERTSLAAVAASCFFHSPYKIVASNTKWKEQEQSIVTREVHYLLLQLVQLVQLVPSIILVLPAYWSSIKQFNSYW